MAISKKGSNVIYVFDSCALVDLFKHYYVGRFPTLWEKFDSCVEEGTIISVREVRNELDGYNDRLSAWTKSKPEFFHSPEYDELHFVSSIFQVNHFQGLIRQQERLKGKPVADPFVIAKAKCKNGTVVTQEAHRPNGAKIPNVCEYFGIFCINLEGFMEKENWTF